jgi:hypothetical protein
MILKFNGNFNLAINGTKIVSGGPALWPRWLHSCT